MNRLEGKYEGLRIKNMNKQSSDYTKTVSYVFPPNFINELPNTEELISSNK